MTFVRCPVSIVSGSMCPPVSLSFWDTSILRTFNTTGTTLPTSFGRGRHSKDSLESKTSYRGDLQECECGGWVTFLGPWYPLGKGDVVERPREMTLLNLWHEWYSFIYVLLKVCNTVSLTSHLNLDSPLCNK